MDLKLYNKLRRIVTARRCEVLYIIDVDQSTYTLDYFKPVLNAYETLQKLIMKYHYYLPCASVEYLKTLFNGVLDDFTSKRDNAYYEVNWRYYVTLVTTTREIIGGLENA